MLTICHSTHAGIRHLLVSQSIDGAACFVLTLRWNDDRLDVNAIGRAEEIDGQRRFSPRTPSIDRVSRRFSIAPSFF